jgi:hypothetical protein
MRKMMLLCGSALAVMGIGVLFSQSALAQGSGSSRSTPSRPARSQTTKEFADSLWRFIVRPQSPYTKWDTLPAGTAERRSSEEQVHGPNPKVYVNPTALQDPAAPSHGSILVIEDYADDGKTRNSISIMYRVKGADPDHFDWYWMRYFPNGSLATADSDGGAKPIVGKVKSCIDCHEKAGGKDLVFTNDAAE